MKQFHFHIGGQTVTPARQTSWDVAMREANQFFRPLDRPSMGHWSRERETPRPETGIIDVHYRWAERGVI